MSDPVVLKVETGEAQLVCFTGQSVKGIIDITLNEDLDKCDLEIELLCTYVFRDQKTRSLKNEKFSFNHSKLGFEDSPSVFRNGKYRSHFSMDLRPDLPSSLECNIISVRYMIHVTCTYMLPSQDAKKLSVSGSKFISVNQLCDLNVVASYETGGAAESNTMYGILCCYGCSLTAFLDTKRVAYVCGEKILVSACINNLSYKIVSKTKLGLWQVVKTKTNQRQKTLVAVKERGPVMRYCRQIWLEEELLIPSLPCTSSDTQFSVKYYVELLLIRDDGGEKTARIPITIGNVPFEENKGLIKDSDDFQFSHGGVGDAPASEFQPVYIQYNFDY